MKKFSVNQALDQAAALNGAWVIVEGLLRFEFEHSSISHWPKAEQTGGTQSSIWLDPHEGIFQFDEAVLTRWSGKRVVVFGEIEFVPDSGMDGNPGGFGHFDLWPMRIRVRRIDRWKRWREQHP